MNQCDTPVLCWHIIMPYHMVDRSIIPRSDCIDDSMRAKMDIYPAYMLEYYPCRYTVLVCSQINPRGHTGEVLHSAIFESVV